MAEPTKIAQPRTGPDRQLLVPCDCVGACECLFVTEWDDGEGTENWQCFEFYSSHRVDSWRQRLKAAWLSLRGKQPFHHAIVTTPEQGRELGEWLMARAAHRNGVHYIPVADEISAQMGDWSEPVQVKVEEGELLFREAKRS